MNDTVRRDIRVASSSRAGARRAAAHAVRRLKQLGGDFGHAWSEIMQGVQEARRAHPVISAHRPR